MNMLQRLVPLLVLGLSGCGQAPTVDPAVVGEWEIPVSGGYWVLGIQPDGTYNFYSDAGDGVGEHSGTFSASDGRWQLIAQEGNLSDEGTYRLQTTDVLVLEGQQGTRAWRRSQARATAQTQPRPPSPQMLPDTIDPCRLITSDEAASALGASVTKEQTTPQPRTQNNCRYRVPQSYRKSLSLMTLNGHGVQVDGWMNRLQQRGWQPVAGVGDMAFVRVNDQINPPSVTVEYMVQDARGTVTLTGPELGTLESTGIQLARSAAGRLASGEAAFQMPGTDAFAGDWLVVSQATFGPYKDLKFIAHVKPSGEARVIGVNVFRGILSATDNQYQIGMGNDLAGTYELSGDRIRIDGTMSADLGKVPCRVPPRQVQVPYPITYNFTGALNGTALRSFTTHPGGLRQNVTGTSNANPGWFGLWEGEARLKTGQPGKVLWSIATNGQTAMVFLPYWDTEVVASNGNLSFKGAPSGFPFRTGTYQLLGGIRSDTISTFDEGADWHWSQTTLGPRSKGSPTVMGHCPP